MLVLFIVRKVKHWIRLPEVEVDVFDVDDEGPIPCEQHEDDLPPHHAFL